MDFEVYKEQLHAIENEYNDKKTILQFRYAKELRRFELRDIIEFKGTIIIVDSFGYSAYQNKAPYPVYKGREMTKKLQLKKSKETNRIWDNPEIKLLKKNYNEKE